MNTLTKLDIFMLDLINNRLSNSLFDRIMPFLTSFGNFKIPLIITVAILFIFCGKRVRLTLILAILALAVADAFSSGALKTLFQRIRPCHELEDIRLLVNCSSSFSFPSSHCSNTFAVASVVAHRHGMLTLPLYLLASAVAYSRVYVGVHYPSDAFAGIIAGIFCAFLIITVTKKLGLTSYDE